MEIPLANLRAASSGAAELSVLDSAIAAAKVVADEVGPRFRIKTSTTVRDWLPADTERIQEVSDKLRLGKFYEGGRTKVLDAENFGVIGYSQVWPGWTRGSRITNGEVAFIGVLPEFRNASASMFTALRRDLSNSNEPWITSARDNTSGRLLDRFEQEGLIDVLNRYHTESPSRPETQYIFRINSDTEAAIARRSIVADINVRPAIKQDIERIQQINDKYGLKWIPELVNHTTVAQARGHDVVGFAYFNQSESKIKALGVLPQFHASSDALIRDVAAQMQGPERPISIMGHHLTTGRILDHLERTGTIKKTSQFQAEGMTFYDFVVPHSTTV